jgi:hypothetical protein
MTCRRYMLTKRKLRESGANVEHNNVCCLECVLVRNRLVGNWVLLFRPPTPCHFYFWDVFKRKRTVIILIRETVWKRSFKICFPLHQQDLNKQKICIFNLLKHTGHVMLHQFNIQNSTLCQHCIYVFYIYLWTNIDVCHLHHKLISFYKRDEKCLLRGTNWVFK